MSLVWRRLCGADAEPEALLPHARPLQCPAAYDHMVENLDFDEPAGRDGVNRDSHVFCGRRRVAAWVVMHHDDGGGVLTNCVAEQFAHAHDAAIQSASVQFTDPNDVMFCRQQHDVQVFSFEIHEVGAKELDDIERRSYDPSVLWRRQRKASREFEGGFYFDGFDRPNATSRLKVRQGGTCQSGETTMRREGAGREVKGALSMIARGAGAPDNRDQFGDAQRFWPVRCQAFARALRRRHIANRDVGGTPLDARRWLWFMSATELGGGTKIADGAASGTRRRLFAVVHGPTVSGHRQLRRMARVHPRW